MPESDLVPSAAGRRRKARRFAGQARSSLLWGMALFAVAHLALLIGTREQRAQLRDPEFGCKLSRLRQQQVAEADRPLLVLLGSSRTGQGFRPGALAAFKTPDGRTPFVFNFSQVGSGPLAELVCLRRLLDAGVRPDWLAIEILPPLLGRTVDAYGNPDVGVSRLSGSDLRLLRRYVSDPGTLTRRWIEAQLFPWHAHRFSLMNHYAGDFLPWRLRMDQWKALDAWGWSDLGVDTEHPVKDPRALEVARKTYQDELKNFHITPMQDRALRDLIALCRKEAIPTVLYLMPEGSIFRSWYVPTTRAVIEDYLTRLSRECDVPIIDARLWMPDDLFWDSHHLDRRGATRFSRRFGEEVISSLVQGKLDAIRPVVVPLQRLSPDAPRQQAPLLEVRDRPAELSPPILSITGGTAHAEGKGDATHFPK